MHTAHTLKQQDEEEDTAAALMIKTSIKPLVLDVEKDDKKGNNLETIGEAECSASKSVGTQPPQLPTPAESDSEPNPIYPGDIKAELPVPTEKEKGEVAEVLLPPLVAVYPEVR